MAAEEKEGEHVFHHAAFVPVSAEEAWVEDCCVVLTSATLEPRIEPFPVLDSSCPVVAFLVLLPPFFEPRNEELPATEEAVHSDPAAEEAILVRGAVST